LIYFLTLLQEEYLPGLEILTLAIFIDRWDISTAFILHKITKEFFIDTGPSEIKFT
jgi:hypothetical protein